MLIDTKIDPNEDAGSFYTRFAGREPVDYRQSDADGPEEIDGEIVYWASLCVGPRSHTSNSVTEEQYRFIEQFEQARQRQEEAEKACAEARWAPPPPPPPPREPEPEEIPPKGTLTPRQEDFCQQYAAQLVATRAAVLAGYSDNNASAYGSRLLNNPLVLDRIARLRDERKLHYVLQRDTLHDKLEALYFGALDERNHAAAVSVVKLQAMLAGMFARLVPQKVEGFERAAAARKARKSQGRRAKKPAKAKVKARQKPGKAKESQRKPR